MTNTNNNMWRGDDWRKISCTDWFVSIFQVGRVIICFRITHPKHILCAMRFILSQLSIDPLLYFGIHVLSLILASVD